MPSLFGDCACVVRFWAKHFHIQTNLKFINLCGNALPLRRLGLNWQNLLSIGKLWLRCEVLPLPPSLSLLRGDGGARDFLAPFHLGEGLGRGRSWKHMEVTPSDR
jgi:hypothetical protein